MTRPGAIARTDLSCEQLARLMAIEKGDLKKLVGSLALASKATKILKKVVVRGPRM